MHHAEDGDEIERARRRVEGVADLEARRAEAAARHLDERLARIDPHVRDRTHAAEEARQASVAAAHVQHPQLGRRVAARDDPLPARPGVVAGEENDSARRS